MGAVAVTLDAEPSAPPPPPRSPSVPRWTFVAFALGGLVLLVIAGVALVNRGDDAPAAAWGGRVLDPGPERPTTDLVDTSGAPFDLRTATGGRTTLVFFGYTNCPDVCSIQMATLSQALERVEVAATVVFITTDPARDTPERLRSWLDNFDSSFVGATGSPEAIAGAQRDLGVSVAVSEEPGTDGDYTVGHSSAVYVFTPDDVAHLAYPAGTRQQDWVDDLPRIAAEREWSGS
jgi:protein SCO1/2